MALASSPLGLSVRDRLVLRYLVDRNGMGTADLINISRALPTGNAYPTVLSLAGRGLVELVGERRANSRVKITADGLEAIILSGT